MYVKCPNFPYLQHLNVDSSQSGKNSKAIKGQKPRGFIVDKHALAPDPSERIAEARVPALRAGLRVPAQSAVPRQCMFGVAEARGGQCMSPGVAGDRKRFCLKSQIIEWMYDTSTYL